MLGALIRSLFGLRAAPTPAEPIPADTLYLVDSDWLRVIVPPREETYAALVNSAQGLVIVNRNDLGVGWQLRTRGAYDPQQMRVLETMTRAAPPGALALDVGANIGITSLTMARAIGRAGLVHAFEPQRPLFHMLAGNLALNGIDNVQCHCLAVGLAPGEARIPRLDYRAEASFGSIELNHDQQSDAHQQALGGVFDKVPQTSVDALGLARLDMVKIDVEGMEADVLAGAAASIAAYRPLMYIEYLKSGKEALGKILDAAGYVLLDAGDNFVCIPAGDSRLAGLTAALQLPPWKCA